MFTSAECRQRAEQKLKLAECDIRHRKRLLGPRKLGLLSLIERNDSRPILTFIANPLRRSRPPLVWGANFTHEPVVGTETT
jgi:hypothetical protein